MKKKEKTSCILNKKRKKRKKTRERERAEKNRLLDKSKIERSSSILKNKEVREKIEYPKDNFLIKIFIYYLKDNQ